MNSKRNGKGINHYPDGGIYDGIWRNNLQEGYGKYNFASGE